MAEIEIYNYKKILMKNLCFVFLALILLSCKEQKDSSHKEYVFNKSTATDDDLNKLFSDVDYIPLESTNETLIGFNPQLYVSSSKIYIYDHQYNKRVLVFNREGGFERFIGNVGGGPGEYTMAKNFVVNEPDDEVIINASPTGTLYHYGLDGTFRNIESLKVSISAFTLADKNKYWIYTGRNTLSGPDRLLLYKGNQKEKGFLPFDSERSPADSECFSNSPIRTFQESFYENIYHIKGDTLRLMYKLNFGKLQVPQNVLDGTDEDFGNFIKQNPYIAVFRYLENNHFIYAGLIEYDGKELKALYHWVIDKRNDKDAIIKMEPENTYFMGLQYPLQLTENDELVFLMNSPFFNEINKKGNGVFYKENFSRKVYENPILTTCKLTIIE